MSAYKGGTIFWQCFVAVFSFTTASDVLCACGSELTVNGSSTSFPPLSLSSFIVKELLNNAYGIFTYELSCWGEEPPPVSCSTNDIPKVPTFGYVAQCLTLKFDNFDGLSGMYRDCVYAPETMVTPHCKSYSNDGFSFSGDLCFCNETLCNNSTLPPQPPTATPKSDVECSCDSSYNGDAFPDPLRSEVKQLWLQTGYTTDPQSCSNNATTCSTSSIARDSSRVAQCYAWETTQYNGVKATMRDCIVVEVERIAAGKCATVSNWYENSSACFCDSDNCNINILPGLQCSCESTVNDQPLNDVGRLALKSTFGKGGLHFGQGTCLNGVKSCNQNEIENTQTTAKPSCAAIMLESAGQNYVINSCISINSDLSMCTCDNRDLCNSFIILHNND